MSYDWAMLSIVVPCLNEAQGISAMLSALAPLRSRGAEVIVVDEPMVGLDPKAAKILKDLFREYTNRGHTIIFSTHTLEVAESLCDHEPSTLLGLQRICEGDRVRESFRTLHRRASRLEPLSAFRFVEIEEETPAEEVDLVALARKAPR